MGLCVPSTTLVCACCTLLIASGSLAFGQQPSRPSDELLGLPEPVVQSGHSESILAIEFSPDGKVVASASMDGTVKLWLRATGQLLRTLPISPYWVYSVAFSPSGALLATGDGDNTVQVWEVSAGRRLWAAEGHARAVKTVGFSRDGSRLFSRGADGSVSIWDPATGQKSPSAGGNGAIPGLDFVPFARLEARSLDGRWLARPQGQNIEIIEERSGRVMATISSPPVAVRSVAPSPDGKLIAAGLNSGDVILWDTNRGLPIRSLPAHVGSGEWRGVHSLGFNAGGTSLLTSGQDGRVLLWNLASTAAPLAVQDPPGGISRQSRESRLAAREERLPPPSNIPKAPRGLTASVDGNDDAVPVTKEVYTSAISPSGQYFAYGGFYFDARLKTNFVSVIDAGSHREAAFIANAQKEFGDAKSLSFSADDRSLAIGYEEGGLIVWDVASRRQNYSVAAHRQTINSVQFSPLGTILASASADHSVKVWERSSGRLIQTLNGHQSAVLCLAFSADGSKLASGGADNRILLWDANTGALLRSLEFHSAAVNALAFLPRSNLLVSGSEDGTLALWDTQSSQPLASTVSFAPNKWLVFTPDGLFDGTADGMQAMTWRGRSATELVSLDAFFTDYFRPGLLADVMEGHAPKAQVDIGVAVQVPGLRTMMEQHEAHLENRAGQVLVCFADLPGVAVGIAAGQTDIPVEANGYQVAPDDKTCRYQKKLPAAGNPAALMQKLENWQLDDLTTPWDGKRSSTANATLHVLTVGIAAYPAGSGFDVLPYAAASARAVEEFFAQHRDRPGKPYARVRVWPGLYDMAATRDGIRLRLSEMAQAMNEDDVVVLYLVGHGSVVPGEEMFYFVPLDGRETEMRKTGLSTAMLAEALRNMPARRMVLVIDACQSGGAVEALGRIGEAKARMEERILKLGPRAPGTRESGVGVHVIAATLPLAYAVQLQPGQSALAATLLQAMKNGAGSQTVEQVVEYVRRQLPDASEKSVGFRQVPMVRSIGWDFVLAGE